MHSWIQAVPKIGSKSLPSTHLSPSERKEHKLLGNKIKSKKIKACFANNVFTRWSIAFSYFFLSEELE